MLRGGRPRKLLEELVADGTFLARRHAELLGGPPVEDPRLAGLQRMYRRAEDDQQRRRVAISFEKLVRQDVPVREPAGEPAVVEPDAEAAVEPVEPQQPAETYAELIQRVWRQPTRWRERGVDPADGHRHSNVEHIPGSYSSPYTWPPLEPPSKDDG
jgi:hypothetical protein